MVLIVEDEAVSRKALAHILRLHGHQARGAESGEEAIAMIHDGSVPEAAIVDVNLPGMSGFEFARRLRSEYPQVPCVFVTANDEASIHHLRRGQRQATLQKPFDVRKLLSWIDDLRGRRSGIADA
jgi:CheY-like chemotaxis protein